MLAKLVTREDVFVGYVHFETPDVRALVSTEHGGIRVFLVRGSEPGFPYVEGACAIFEEVTTEHVGLTMEKRP